MKAELLKAAERIRGTAMNPHRGLDEWYPVHPGDDAGIETQRRAYCRDMILVAEYATAIATGNPHPSHQWNRSVEWPRELRVREFPGDV